MVRSMGRVAVRDWIPTVVLVLVLVAGPPSDGVSETGLWLILAVPGRDRAMPGLVGSIASGALVVAVLGWIGATLLDLQVDPGLAAGWASPSVVGSVPLPGC